MKRIVAAFAALVLSVPLFALDVAVGGRSGLYLNMFDFKCGDTDGDMKLACGFGVSGLVNVGIPSVVGLGVQGELGFNYHNIKQERSNRDYDWSFIALDIPLLATYKINISEMFFVQPELGPKFSFIIGDVKGDVEIDADDLATPFNVGLVAGATFGINNMGPGSILLNLRYNRDFTKITDDAHDIALGSNQSLDISVGYQIKVR